MQVISYTSADFVRFFVDGQNMACRRTANMLYFSREVENMRRAKLRYMLLSLLIAAAAIGLCLFALLSRIDLKTIGQPPETETAQLSSEPTPTATEPEPSDAEPTTEDRSAFEAVIDEVNEHAEPVVTTVSLMAVGDNLIHNMVYNSGMGTDPWNYDHLYAQIQPDLDAADVSVINQETIFVSDHANISNYPVFGTPREVGDAVYKAGFDVILQATNHTMDKGIGNVYDAIDYWSDKDVTVLGIHKSAEDAKTPTILEVNGIKMGMLNYTYGLNGFGVPSDQSYAIDLLDNEAKLMADIAYCEEHADITIGFWHMGVEYMTTPTPDAKAWAEKTVAAGCDLLICCHPHVLQPYEFYTAANGNTALVYWSLGNFISAMDQVDTLLGGMAKVTLQKTVQGTESRVEIVDYTLEPLVSHVNYGTNFTTYHLEDYSDYLGAYNALCPLTTAQLWDRFYTIVGKPDP